MDLPFNSIRAKLREVTDLFFTTPVTLQMVSSSEVYDPFGENQSTPGLVEVTTDCMCESVTDKQYLSRMENTFSHDREVLSLTFNFDQLTQLGLTVDHKVKLNPTIDYCIIKEEKYRIVYVGYDGPLQADPVLVMLYVQKIERGHAQGHFQ